MRITNLIDGFDMFAGGGGFSEGARQAGVRVIAAANHWPAAVQVHQLNHPDTEHFCQDLQQMDWEKVRGDFHLLMASPACQGHSRARGKDRPHHDATRATAMAVLSCAEFHRPPLFIVENVPEFRKWVLYPTWKDGMQRLGYAMTEHVLDAADSGVPQHRERLFVVGVKAKHPLKLKFPKRPHVAASTILEWASGNWSPILHPVKDRAPATLSRIAVGRKQFGKRFLIAYYGNESGGRSLDVPLGTVTTKDRFALIDGPNMRMLTLAEYQRAMAFPHDYAWGTTNREMVLKMLGNAVPPPLARDVITATLQAA